MTPDEQQYVRRLEIIEANLVDALYKIADLGDIPITYEPGSGDYGERLLQAYNIANDAIQFSIASSEDKD